MTDGAGFPVLMLLTPLLLLALVVGVPVVQAVILSLHKAILTRPNAGGFIGLANYREMVVDPAVWAAVGRSVVYMAGTVAGSLLLGFVCALATRRLLAGVTLARLLLILPWSIPAVAAALVWGVMYDANFGVINQMIRTVFPGMQNIEWLLGRYSTLPSLIAIQIWNEFPIAYLFLLAGLQQLPDELYEAAQIDGATRLQQFWHVTLPQMRYVFSVTAVLLSIFAFKSFAIIFILTGGGPAGRTETLVMRTYNEAFRSYDFGYSATLGVLSVVISLLLVFVYFRLTIGRNVADSAS